MLLRLPRKSVLLPDVCRPSLATAPPRPKREVESFDSPSSFSSPRLAPPVRGVDSIVGQGCAERVITRASLGRPFACPAVSSGCALSHRLPDVSPHRHRRDLQASGNGPGAQAWDMVQPQDLSYFTLGQSRVRHRDALLQIPREFHGGRLSRVTQLRGSDLMHRSGAYRKSDQHPAGITDHFPPE